MKIYADFNGVEPCLASNELCLDLTGYGTLSSLSFQGEKLHSGKQYTFVDSDGLSVVATVEFNPNQISLNCSGWFAKFKKSDLFNAASIQHDFYPHLCLKCRANIKAYLDIVGKKFEESCPYCGTSVMAPLAPP